MRSRESCIRYVLLTVLLIFSVRCIPSQAQNNSGGETFFEKVGFYADINIGYDLRFNGYSTYDPLLNNNIPVSFSTKELSVLDLSLETGLLHFPFVNFEYKGTVPRTEFQQRALEFRENQTQRLGQGLEKYTLGINTMPLWELILPEKTAGFIKWVLSGKFRSVRELTQTKATVDESSLFLAGADANQSPEFNQGSAGAAYSFTSEYRYNSYTWPLLSNLNYDDERIKANFIIFVGYAKWNFDRSYATYFPDFSDQVIYPANVNTQAATAEMHINSRRNFEQNRGWGFDFGLVYGYGFDNKFTGNEATLNELFYPGGDQQIDIANQNYEVEFAYKQYLFAASDKIDMFIKPGLDANLFWTSFNNYQEPGADGKSFSKIDYFITPWVELSINI